MAVDFSKYGEPVTKTSSGVDFTKYGTPSSVQNSTQVPPKQEGIIKSLIKAPLTMIARPIQAVAELAGASPESVNTATKKIAGDFVAPVPQNFSDVGKDIGRGAETVALGLGPVSGGALFGAGNSLEQGNNLLSTQTAFETVLGAAGGKVLDLVGKPLLNAAGKVVGKITPDVLKTVVSKGTQSIKDFAENHSILPDNISKSINNIAKPLSEFGTKAPELSSVKNNADLINLQERISPKETVKEARLAQAQGRLIKGKAPTLFKSGTADTILPTDKVINASKTIVRNIPNHAELSDPELYTALDDKTTQIAKNLQPKMEQVSVDPETVRKINTDWQDIKKSQIESADATDEPNVLKEQKQFQQRLQKTKGGNLNDLWQERISYDNSVPDSVKNANINSPESLQNKKTRWLQNRKVFNDAIHDSSFGLGKTSKDAFSDMTDMYSAKTGLQTKAKVETKIQPSKLSQAYHSKTGKVIRTVGKLGVGFEALKEGGKIIGGL